ncbi:Gfo/Idh/MocA family protein, partial [Vagococcus sp.]|uniref:Gfo/Idh/MocA family protein n=1 Tax=Vagococcus sp. TaxID=1933889 RepID=UPI002FC89483
MINKIGVVGTGEIANQFVSQLDKENYSVISVYNHREVTLKAFVEKFGIKEYHTNYDEFLMNESMDCVYIATPNQTHYDFVLKALNSGKHVLCEKVMVLEGQQAEELFNLAEQKGLVLIEAVTLFFMPMYQQILTYLNNEKLGKLSGVNVTFGSCKEYDPENRFFSPEKGGGALSDIGTYALSAAVYLLGTDLKMIATDVEFSKSGVDEKSVTLLKNAEGLQASVMISFRGKMPKQIILAGDKGYLMINDFPRAEKATIFYNDGEKEIIELGNGRDVFTYEMDLLNQYNKGNIKGCDVRQVTKQVIS